MNKWRAKCTICKRDIKPIAKRSEQLEKEIITGIYFYCKKCDVLFLLDNDNTTKTLNVCESYERKKKLVDGVIKFFEDRFENV